MLRQVRRSSPRTKLKINSSAMSRRTNRSASLKSCLRPRGARLENACANCKRRYGSNSNHTVRQYCAVDSITASSTLCSRNQIDNRCRSLGMVVNLRRSGFSSGVLASITPPLALSCARQFPLSCRTWLPPGVEAAERAHTDVKHRHVLPPSRWDGGAHRLVQNARSRSNSETASLHPEPCRPLPSHAGPIVHLPTRPDFHRYGWAAAHVNSGGRSRYVDYRCGLSPQRSANRVCKYRHRGMW